MGIDTLTVTKKGIVRMIELEITLRKANLNQDLTTYTDQGQYLPHIRENNKKRTGDMNEREDIETMTTIHPQLTPVMIDWIITPDHKGIKLSQQAQQPVPDKVVKKEITEIDQ